MNALTPQNEQYKEMIMKRIGGNHFLNFVGFEITHIEPGLIETELAIKPHHLQQAGFIHGGVTATAADIACGFASFTLIKEKQGLVTIEMKVSYLNPGLGGILWAKGMVVKAGQKMHFCEAEIWTIKGEEKILIAKASATMAVLNPEDMKKNV